MTQPFGTSAPALWAAGFSAIPLLPRQKRPIVKGWSQFAHELPSKEVQDIWMLGEGVDGSNVGVAMGPASGVVALDIDTDDLRVLGIIEQTMPPSPWTRVGKKGKVLLYRFESWTTTFRVDGADGKRLFELLSAGTQIVVPPSIHPETGREYYANCDLAGVKREDIRPLPANIEFVIRSALEDAGVSLKGGRGAAGTPSEKAKLRVGDWQAAGGRDTKMTAMAGLLVRGVTRSERTLREAMNEMREWVENYTEKVFGDELSVDKAQRKVVEFLLRDVTGKRKMKLPPGWDNDLTDEDKVSLGLGILTEESRSWSFEEIGQFIQVELARPDIIGNQAALAQIAGRAIDRVASNRSLTDIELGSLLRFVADATGTSVVDLRKQVVKLRKGAIEGNNHNEIAEAALEDLQAYGALRFDGGKFWQWRGSHWAVYAEENIRAHIAKEYSDYHAAKKRNDHKGCVEVMKEDEKVRKPLSEMDGLCGINFVNGFLTDGGQLLPHAPDLGMTYVLRYAYRPELLAEGGEGCPKWLAMLEAFWGDDEDYRDKVKLLQEAFAVTLFGTAPKYDRAFMLYGVAHSGKTQIREVLEGLMPAGCRSTVPPTDFGDKFAPAQMAGKLLNIGGEISENKKIDGSQLKQIVSGEEISVQHKFKDQFQMKSTCAQWFLGNHLPRTDDSSEGFLRRLLFLKFDKRFPTTVGVKVQNKGRLVVAEEREAIAAWAVEGMKRFLNQGGKFTEPASHVTVWEDVANMNNDVRDFIVGFREEGRLLLGKQAHRGKNVNSTLVTTLFNVYHVYCCKLGHAKHADYQAFKTRLDELQGPFGFELKKHKRRDGVVQQILFIPHSCGLSDGSGVYVDRFEWERGLRDSFVEKDDL